MKTHQLLGMITNKIFVMGIFCFFTNCVQKKKCDIEPISKEEIDIALYNKDIIVENNDKRTDTLHVIDKYDRLQSTSIKSLSNDKACGHYVGFTYEFNTEIIEIHFFKNEIGIEISVSNNCTVTERMIIHNNFKQNSTFQINLNNCDKSELEDVTFRNFEFNSLKFKDNIQWTVIR